jgi:hypothetical protein
MIYLYCFYVFTYDDDLQMILVPFNSNTTGVTRGAWTTVGYIYLSQAIEFTPVFANKQQNVYGCCILRNNFDENGKTEKVISLKELQKHQLKKLDNDPFWKNKFEDAKR